VTALLTQPHPFAAMYQSACSHPYLHDYQESILSSNFNVWIISLSSQ